MVTLIKEDELKPIVKKLNKNQITYGKAIEIITEICNMRLQSINNQNCHHIDVYLTSNGWKCMKCGDYTK